MKTGNNLVQCKPDPNCKGCYYYRGTIGRGSNLMMCMYWSIEDKLRGCPPGAGCDKYTRKKPTRKELRSPELRQRKSSWDTEYGYQLYCKGYFAKDIARECCCSKHMVNHMFAEWRKRAEAEGIDRDLNRKYTISKWNSEEGYRFYCQGWTADEIARYFEVGKITVDRAFPVWKTRATAEGIDHHAEYTKRRTKLKNGTVAKD